MSCAAGGGDAHGTQSPPKSPEMPRKSSNEGSLFGKVKNIVGKGLGMAHEAYFGKGENPKSMIHGPVLKEPPRIVEKRESSMSGHVSGSVSEPGFPAHHVSQRSKAVFDAVISSEKPQDSLAHPVLEQNEEFGPLVLHGLPLKSPVVQKTNETQPPMQHTPYTWFDNPELDPKFQHGAIVLEGVLMVCWKSPCPIHCPKKDW